MLKVTCSIFILSLCFATVCPQPKVSPDSYKESASPTIQFTCSDASLKPGELLAWYQSRDVVTFGRVENSVNDFSSYTFFPVAGNTVRFPVRAPHHAYVALTGDSRKISASFTLLIEQFKNDVCAVRKDGERYHYSFLCRGALSDAEFRGFWIQWNDGTMSFGREGDATVLLSWAYPRSFVVT